MPLFALVVFSDIFYMKFEENFFMQREYLKIAQQYFQLVGGSASECGKTNSLPLSSLRALTQR